VKSYWTSIFFDRNIRTVSIQIEVTKYLYQCLTNPDPEITVPDPVTDSRRHSLPTMFGNMKIRTDLVNMVGFIYFVLNHWTVFIMIKVVKVFVHFLDNEKNVDYQKICEQSYFFKIIILSICISAVHVHVFNFTNDF
jgi:hypothetical protein